MTVVVTANRWSLIVQRASNDCTRSKSRQGIPPAIGMSLIATTMIAISTMTIVPSVAMRAFPIVTALIDNSFVLNLLNLFRIESCIRGWMKGRGDDRRE